MYKCGIERLKSFIFKLPRSNRDITSSRLIALFFSDESDQLAKCKTKRKNPFDSDTESPEKKK